MIFRKPCVRCLLRDLPDGEALRASVRELIDLIPEGERAPAESVRQRLNACRACPNLSMGTCALCGCYVEHRAERLRAFCPDVPSRWPAASEQAPVFPEI